MKRRAYVRRAVTRGLRLSLAAGLLWCAGCQSSGDPRRDDIFFSPERAEREQLAPRRAQLAREQTGSEAERIRELTLKRRLSMAAAARQSGDASLQRLRARQEARMRELAQLKRQVAEAQARGRVDRDLIKARDQRQTEVDQLTAELARRLEQSTNP